MLTEMEVAMAANWLRSYGVDLDMDCLLIISKGLISLNKLVYLFFD